MPNINSFIFIIKCTLLIIFDIPNLFQACQNLCLSITRVWGMCKNKLKKYLCAFSEVTFSTLILRRTSALFIKTYRHVDPSVLCWHLELHCYRTGYTRKLSADSKAPFENALVCLNDWVRHTTIRSNTSLSNRSVSIDCYIIDHCQ